MGLEEETLGTADPEKYDADGPLQGALLMSVGENSGRALGKTVTMAGEERNRAVRLGDWSMRIEMHWRMGASCAFGGAEGGSMPSEPGSCTKPSAPGRTKP